jgi:phosphohistidine swiveling domain-containing protein
MAVMSLIKQARSQLAARRELWSDMTDWNPAEMLGDRPRPLAVSLYQYLVTNEAWIRGRASLGYRYVTPSALVETIAGKPYVNVRRSFLSLTPASVPTELAQRLVEDRLEALAERPQLHDKVELDLLFTAADVAKPERTTCLLERGFSRSEVDELNAHLRTLTDSVLTNYARFQANDAQLIQELAGWCARCRPPRHERDLNALLSFVRAGLRNCRDQGVVPFARQARAAFIARDLLSRLTASSCIEAHWLDAWWRSLDTVAQRVTHAVVDLGEGRIARSDFDAAFGHLRARTYDICSPRYDQIQWMPSATMRCPARGDPPLLGSVERARIEEGLRGAGLHMSADEFLDFARGAMKAREETKFGFSLVLSDVLEALSLVGEAVGFSREDLSFLRIEDVTDPANEAATLADLRSRWQELVRSRHDLWATGLRVALSDFLSGAEDLLVARRYLARPNFVTRETVAADVTVLDSPAPSPGVTLSGKIVVTEAADPGFDWIFALGIAGLVTRYGGSVSHMAIRCGEFGLPAAIGCGDELFQRIARARRVLLDCADGRIEILE